MYSSNHSTLFYLILARTLDGQNSYRGKSVSLGRFMSSTADMLRRHICFIMIFLSMFQLPRMNSMLNFMCIDLVELRGMQVA